ncbi:MAG: bifunctional phosphopantothenoylcysteine decarboxylase/phosphopantothenate--cysteine ligase CoaBC [Candidatus Aminicenantes bacterium]|nr:bifunctional phosphopantothenoylcysteine decarboxylase/phosphopantothenate--cysteine ligase CoaBC [Candidatus Aminicenantes bacterium]
MISLGITSSISIYKACEVIRGFQKKNYEVQVIMTENATKMITPLLFSAISKRDVLCDPYHNKNAPNISHVEIAKGSALFLVAPATANMIAKFAAGIADDFLSTFYLAVKCPVLIAPAMNENMLLHPTTQKNIGMLRATGVHVIQPDKGYLACRDEGWGRLASPDLIVETGLKLIGKSRTLEQKTVLITAGPTREPMDPVRYLSSRSSGKMGYSLAEEACRRGAQVILISGPSSLYPPAEAESIRVETAGEMEKAVMESLKRADVIIMAAAVSDFTFSKKAAVKIKKDQEINALRLVKTPDILERVGRKKGKKIVVGFAAETNDLKQNARMKLEMKNLDFIVANNVLNPGLGFESDYNEAVILFPDGKEIQTGRQTKSEISRMIMDSIEDKIGKKSREDPQ